MSGDLRARVAASVEAGFAEQIAYTQELVCFASLRGAEHAEIVAEVARTVVGAENVSTTPKPKMGSEDFADMLRATPGAYFWLGHAGSTPVHNPGFVLDDEILPVGASVFARLIEARLSLGAAA